MFGYGKQNKVVDPMNLRSPWSNQSDLLKYGAAFAILNLILTILVKQPPQQEGNTVTSDLPALSQKSKQMHLITAQLKESSLLWRNSLFSPTTFSALRIVGGTGGGVTLQTNCCLVPDGIERKRTTCTHTYGSFKVPIWLHMNLIVLIEQAGEPGETPCKRKEVQLVEIEVKKVLFPQ